MKMLHMYAYKLEYYNTVNYLFFKVSFCTHIFTLVRTHYTACNMCWLVINKNKTKNQNAFGP